MQISAVKIISALVGQFIKHIFSHFVRVYLCCCDATQRHA